jgi:hypothetical protein
MKRKRTSKAPKADDDFELDFGSHFKVTLPKSRSTSRSVKRAKAQDTRDGAGSAPAKRSARVQKTVREKEIVRQKAGVDNRGARFLKLPGGKYTHTYSDTITSTNEDIEIRNIIYDFCIEDSYVDLIHDTLIPDENPFTGRAPGRALTQVSQQVRAEFVPIYTKTTTVSIHIDDLDAYMATWRRGPVPLSLDSATTACRRKGLTRSPSI